MIQKVFKYNGLAVAALAIALTACNSPTAKNTVDSPTQPKAHHGLRLDYMDTTVSPVNDFYRYANGGYMKSKEIPAEESRWGVFTELGETNVTRIHGIMQECSKSGAQKGSIEQKIGDYYKTAMDSAKIEQLGVKAIQADLDKIAAIKTTADMVPVLASMHRRGMGPLFSLWVDQDAKNSARFIININQGGTGLPEKDYYFAKSPEKENIRKQYTAYLAKLLVLSGEETAKADAIAAKSFEIETKLASKSRAAVDLRDPDANYHLMQMDGLTKACPAIDWKAYFVALGQAEPGDLNLGQPEFFQNLSQLLTSYSIEDWKNYLKLSLLNGMSGNLNNDFVMAHFEFFDKTLSGTEKMKVRWKRVVEGANWGLGFALGQKYTEKYFSANAKKIALEMVDNILNVMKDRLAQRDWMSEETRNQAIHKVETILPKIGYPDKWRDYSKLEMSSDDYIKNVYAVREFGFQYRLDKLGKPVDRTEWGMPPQVVNAYYNPSKNEIVFPAGILQPPFFDEHVDPALNYGGFGAVIGHELIHAFDDEGSQFDADGNLKSWWTPEDRKNFEKRAELVKQQYDAYEVADSLHINGKLTLGENIADIHGLQMSYWAWKQSLKGKDQPQAKDGFTPDQQFFLSYGQIWSNLMRPEYLRLMVATNPHSPAEYRVVGTLSSFPAFYEAFGVKEGDRMWRPEAERSAIW
jgi:putative endopeptidase